MFKEINSKQFQGGSEKINGPLLLFESNKKTKNLINKSFDI